MRAAAAPGAAGPGCGTGMRDRDAGGARRPLLASPLPARTSAERGDGCRRLPGEGESFDTGVAAVGRRGRGDRGHAGARGCRSHPEPGLGLIRAELPACRRLSSTGCPRRGERRPGHRSDEVRSHRRHGVSMGQRGRVPCRWLKVQSLIRAASEEGGG